MSERPRSAEFAAILALCLALFPLALATYSHLAEDAFITFRYVEQFASGHGLVYNRGEIVEGFSNPLWVALLTPFSLAGARLHVAARVLSVACLASLVFVSWVCARNRMGGCWFSWWLPLAIAFQPFLNYHRDQGLETVEYAAVLGAMVLAAGARAWVWAGLAGAAVAVSRPEGLAFVDALWPLDIAGAWQARSGPWRSLRPQLFFLLCPLGVWLAVELARRVYFDNWVPNTVTAKVHGPGGWREIARLCASWWAFPALGFAGAATAWWRNRADFLAAGAALHIAAAVAFELKIGDLTSSGFRYLVPILMPSLVGVWLMFCQAIVLARSPLMRRAVFAASAVLLALNVLIPFRWHSPWIVGIKGDDPHFRLVPRLAGFLSRLDLAGRWEWYFSDPIILNAQVGRWLRSDLIPAHPEAVLAGDQMGMMGYCAPHGTHIVDMLGLMDRHVATYHLAGPALGDYLIERGVDFIVLQSYGPEPREPWIPADLVNRAAVPALRETMENPPVSDQFAPWYHLRARNEAEGFQFIVFGPKAGAPAVPGTIWLGPSTADFLRLWRVTAPQDIPPPP
ncbi:hypothetical protein HZA57_04870 [Candidatus Poribacteria bacterium]|nr:hypothetical protein [Candidatus Poribacteria bacterium]